MTDQITFVVRFILFAAVHSLFATAFVKKILRGSDSQVYRLSYNFASLAMFGWVMSAYRHSDVLYVAPGVWSLIMYMLQLVVAVILFSCLRQTGTGEFMGFTKLTTRAFTTTGWYSIVRHPLYLFSTLFMVLNPVMTSQWLMLTTMAAVYFLIGGLVEERRLLLEFGNEYRRYQQQIPFFIPNLASLSRFSSTGKRPIPDQQKP